MKRFWMIVVVSLVVGMGVQAQRRVPAYPGMIERVQPNGDTLHTYLRGDEHQHVMMTTDGWQIRENRRGWIVYAKKNCKGETVAGCRKAHDEAKRKKCEEKWLEKKGVIVKSE